MHGTSREKLEWLARWGYGTRGIVYTIVGVLAAMAATASGGRTTDSRGALQQLLNQPAGDFILAVVALGLAGYAAWRWVQAVGDADHHGTSAKGLAIRGGLAVSGVIYASLAFFALSLIFGWGTGGGQGSTQNWTARLMEAPYGRVLVGAVGLGVIVAGLAQIYKGWSARFERYFQVDPANRRWTHPVSRFGLVARGLTFVLIGGFFLTAAWRADPNQARGLDGALEALQAQPYGAWLLGAAALGLIAFGVYSFIEAWFRRL